MQETVKLEACYSSFKYSFLYGKKKRNLIIFLNHSLAFENEACTYPFKNTSVVQNRIESKLIDHTFEQME